MFLSLVVICRGLSWNSHLYGVENCVGTLTPKYCCCFVFYRFSCNFYVVANICWNVVKQMMAGTHILGYDKFEEIANIIIAAMLSGDSGI